jgi:hypothetical protein
MVYVGGTNATPFARIAADVRRDENVWFGRARFRLPNNIPVVRAVAHLPL